MEQTTPTDENKAQATPTDDDATPTSEESTQQEKPKDLKPISEVCVCVLVRKYLRSTRSVFFENTFAYRSSFLLVSLCLDTLC